MSRLAGCGYALVVISNQRGISRGAVTEEVLRATEAALLGALRPHGASIEGFYYCPHEAGEGCDCRKPEPGLILQAADELGLDLGASWMIGDSDTDVEAGRAAGCRTVRLGTNGSVTATLAAPDLEAASRQVCES